MASPFDFVKTFTQTNENLWVSDEVSEKEYNSFMVNRILSNSARTILFAEIINQYPDLDKKIQHDFYKIGIPKSTKYEKMWSKKDSALINETHINFIAEQLGVSIKRAIEAYELLGVAKIEQLMAMRGGKQLPNGKQQYNL